jgi:4-hydroxybenzoate polyprenyltransferase
MSNKIDKNKNIALIFLTEFIRIKDVMAWSAISFGGFILGMSSLYLSNYIIPLLVFLVSTFFVMSFTFAINNYYDADSDRENPRRKHINAIASGKISKQTGIILNITFIIIPLVVSILYKFEVFIFCAFLLFLGWAYSVSPLRTKNRPILDVIWHFLGFFSYVIWGSLIAGSIGPMNWLVAISIGVWSSVGQVGNHIADYSFDKDSGTKTFAVWVGLEKAKITINVLTLIHLIILIPLILLYSLSYLITIIIMIVIPIIGLLILKPKKGAFPTRRCFIYFLTVVIGGAVYLSCLVYHFLFIYGKPTLGLLRFIGIP